jgi:hypothetical protein
VNVTDDQHRLRQRLHEELGALEFSPPPVLRVTGRGQEIRTRRRALAIGSLVILVAGGALSVHAAGGQKAAPPRVTVSVPGPGAPGAVFASGTAGGKPWQLAVRNIAADPGTLWCLPAVMFNGRYGDVLYPYTKGAQPYGNPAYLADIPGFPGVGAIFTRVKPGVTKVSASWPGGRTLTVRPVWVSGCGGERFRMAGFAFDNTRGVAPLLTVEGYGYSESLGLGYPGLLGHTPPGLWANTDNDRFDIASSRAAQRIGAGTVHGQVWHIRTSLGLFGQCYTATLRGGPGGGRGQGSECVPIAAPPRTVALAPVSIPGAATAVPGYAGLVNPRAAKVVVSVNNGTNLTIRPTTIAGRAYIAFAIPPGCRVSLLGLYDAAGHMFASTTTLPQR